METESTSNWDIVFTELYKTEDELLKSVEMLEKNISLKKYAKTGYKPEDWRNLHNMISKTGKTVEKLYSGYNFGESFKSDDLRSNLWKSAIFETLIREGYSFNSSCLEGAENHGQAYAQLSEFIESFDYNSGAIFE